MGSTANCQAPEAFVAPLFPALKRVRPRVNTASFLYALLLRNQFLQLRKQVTLLGKISSNLRGLD